jgi:hypothetical protein
MVEAGKLRVIANMSAQRALEEDDPGIRRSQSMNGV